MNTEWFSILNNRNSLPHKIYVDTKEKIAHEVDWGRSSEILCIIGPSGVGKTTLQFDLLDHFIKQQLKGWRSTSGRPIYIEAPPAYKGEFPWRSFMEELLLKLGDKNFDFKVDLQWALENRKAGITTPCHTKQTLGQIESRLRTRVNALRPMTVFIDEAQNMVDGLSDSMVKFNLNRLKNWSNTMNTKFILFGTSEMRPLLSVNEQLARRIKHILFPRYKRDDKADLTEFARLYISIVKKLSVNVDKRVNDDVYFIYDASLGCPGLLVSWVHEAVKICEQRNLPKVTKKVLIEARSTKDRLVVAERAIKNFEAFYDAVLEDFDPTTIFADQVDLIQDDLFTVPSTSQSAGSKAKPGQKNPKSYAVHENQF